MAIEARDFLVHRRRVPSVQDLPMNRADYILSLLELYSWCCANRCPNTAEWARAEIIANAYRK